MEFLKANLTIVLLCVILAIVIPFLIFYLRTAKRDHPKGLIAAALSNMGERFGYYIMNAILLLFLVSKFGLPDATAGLIYSVFYFGIYVLAWHHPVGSGHHGHRLCGACHPAVQP